MENNSKKNQEPVTVTDKKNLAFGKLNFILLAAGVVVVLLGFFLMAGGESTNRVFDPSIFSAMHIKVAPVVTLIGFVSIIFAIIIKPKDK
ncbi:DUF3098 domain-containing protein [uncultured Prevotella sp.]|uniref:DUF3098 domain-containing protein n=1 Tax=uncultured Prevotella sp. TaxID=159272 RepID=UPI0025921269|nr:DUF3098 domain-containing protein [uncultured Prevotella sp.]